MTKMKESNGCNGEWNDESGKIVNLWKKKMTVNNMKNNEEKWKMNRK